MADLRSERVRVFLPGPSRASDVLRYFEANRRHLERWEPARPSAFYTKEYWQTRLAEHERDYRERCAARFFLEADHTIVGLANFTSHIQGVFCCVNLGYAIAQAYEGRGLMHEALSLAIPRVASDFNLHRIQCNYQPSNHRSERLLERLGFVREGYAKDYLFIDGAWRDHVLTSLTLPNCKIPI